MPTEGVFNFSPERNPDHNDTVANFHDRTLDTAERKYKVIVETNIIRNKIETLAKKLKHSHLNGIDADKLSPEDLKLFEKFQNGKVSLAVIKKNQQMVRNLPSPNSSAVRQLLNYMYFEMLHRQKKPADVRQTDLDL